jgi:hypothetical protein
MIYISCNDNPFRLQQEETSPLSWCFLTGMEERLRLLFADTREEIVEPVSGWILKAFEANKDIEMDGLAQLTLPDTDAVLTQIFCYKTSRT